ncbi:hypothetical protein GUJ93_ZPchr0001g32080 [Zizania palustris]|uniref:Uncharacterized protein n=1 Tax=Zizania palustris TaxID=103762 RepID=A0A8J5RZJ1_ZIZPA|nr:hypothetical protein GUJ93_ZPchr0001g32080 [Zizania palustris]
MATATATGHLRVFVVLLVVQACMLAMMAAPWTVQAGAVSTVLSNLCCPMHIAGCCDTAAATDAAGAAAGP